MRYLILSLSLLLSCIASGQVIVSRTQLQNTRWRLSVPQVDYRTTEMSFDSRKVTTNVYFKNIKGSASMTLQYYLTDKVPKTFEEDKVGNSTKGLYLVMQEKDGYSCFVIISLTKNKLSLKPMESGAIGYTDTAIVYTKIE